MSARIKLAVCFTAFALLSLTRASVQAQAQAEASDVRSPGQRSTRGSGYILPKGMWAFEAGALGVGDDELYGDLGIAYGLGAGLQVDVNLAHYTVGLFNIEGHVRLVETQRFAMAVDAAVLYGHGDWVWILDPAGEALLQDADLLSFPINLKASAAVQDWLQLDLGVGYRYATLLGSLGDGESFYASAQIGANQLKFSPGVRFFPSDATAFEFLADLPAYTRVPYEGEISVELADKGYERAGSDVAKVPFTESWSIEAGVRSRLRPGLFCAVRLHYGRMNEVLYDARLYPSFSLEFRL